LANSPECLFSQRIDLYVPQKNLFRRKREPEGGEGVPVVLRRERSAAPKAKAKGKQGGFNPILDQEKVFFLAKLKGRP